MKTTWIKANFVVRTSDGTNRTTANGPIYIGLDEAGNLTATTRWDVPADRAEILSVLRGIYNRYFHEIARQAAPDAYCMATISLGLTPGKDYGMYLSESQQADVDEIEAEEMSWITTDERQAISDSFGLIRFEDSMQIAAAISKAGVVVGLSPETSHDFDR